MCIALAAGKCALHTSHIVGYPRVPISFGPCAGLFGIRGPGNFLIVIRGLGDVSLPTSVRTTLEPTICEAQLPRPSGRSVGGVGR